MTALALAALGFACLTDSVVPPTFDGHRALQCLNRQVSFGPRVPGSEAWRQCREYYTTYFDSLGLSVDSQAFDFVDPYSGATIPLVNLRVIIEGQDPHQPGLLLAAHWDSRPRTDLAVDRSLAALPIDGANDGASGVAVLMELAGLLAAQPPPVKVELLLLDGEDWGRAGHVDYYLLGSREFARRGIRGKYRFAIVLDMVGDKDQQIYREGYSEEYHPELNDMVFDLAKELNITTFHDSVKHHVLDDHLPLNGGGVPAINLIDFDYPYWHTELDTPDKCSAESLENVGKLTTNIIYNSSLWPKN
ncbi:MAG: M28 family peptidase [candidate division Zixibacteria bacterium]|nr:M28 family peptidase [candidate division Zixibacteria bacterium]